MVVAADARNETTRIVCRCSFCARQYTLVDFLKAPFPPSVKITGKDWQELNDGDICIYRDCDCRPFGERTSIAVILHSDGAPVTEQEFAET